MVEGALLLGLDYTWKVSRDESGHVKLVISRGGEETAPLLTYLEEYGDDPLLHRFLLPDNCADTVVATTVNAMRDAAITASRKWNRRSPWPDVPKPSLPKGLAPFSVYWGKIGAALSPDVAARLEASGVVRRLPAPARPSGHHRPYGFELQYSHHTSETGRFLEVFAEYAGEEARAQLCAWMDWGPQWGGWLSELEQHAPRVPGEPSVFDTDW